MRKDALELSRELRDEIREALRPLRPEKVIVFGSYARASRYETDCGGVEEHDG